MKKLLISLLLLTSLSIVHAQEHTYLDSSKYSEAEISQMLADPQVQNNNELTMAVMKAVEDKGIINKQDKLNFIDTMQVSDTIKDVAKTYVTDDLSYSGFTKVSYGTYTVKRCQKKSGQTVHDAVRSGNQCFTYPPFECNL